jgi:hypothetical protein
MLALQHFGSISGGKDSQVGLLSRRTVTLDTPESLLPAPTVPDEYGLLCDSEYGLRE